MKWTPQYHTACQIQRKILAMMGLHMQEGNRKANPDPPKGLNLKPGELCSLTKAWTELEERKRILRMKPKPKDVTVEATERKKRVAPIFTE